VFRRQEMEITKTQKAFVVIGNTDLTEGRGGQTYLNVALSETTAQRLATGKYVMGSTCPIEEVEIFEVKTRLHNGITVTKWYGPVVVEYPSEEDKALDKRRADKASALKKAEEMGLTKAELAALLDNIK